MKNPMKKNNGRKRNRERKQKHADQYRWKGGSDKPINPTKGGMYDNGYNISNFVAPQKVLRLKLHHSFPVLYLPEYISRRCFAEEGKQFLLPKNISSCYQAFLKKMSKRKKKYYSGIVENKSNLNFDSSSQSKNEKLHETFVQMIVIPLNHNLIAKVAYPQDNTHSSYPERHEVKSGNSITGQSETNSKRRNQCSLMNCYQDASRPKRKLNQVSQSLETLTDEVISTLVHQKKHVTNKTKQDSVEYIYQCHGINILSEGYRLASDEYITHSYKPNIPGKRRRTDRNTNTTISTGTVAHCSNMRPGVRCTHPNSCASYARSAPLMKLLHRLIGDDFLRELMLRCIILIPISPRKGDGNYFQLCGPPLPMISLKARPEGFRNQIDTDDICQGASRKRTRCNSETVNAEHVVKATKLSKPSDKIIREGTDSKFDPFWIVPRYRMFYADSYSARVGFPPRHILNQSNPTDTSGKPISLEVHLFHNLMDLTKPKKKMRSKYKKHAYNGSLDICRQIIKRHRRCDYHRLLSRYCPLPDFKCNDGSKEQTLEDLIACRADKKKVVSFFKGVLKNVFPPEFWGSSHNFQVVLDTMEVFLTMRKKEEMPMKLLMKGIRIQDIGWLFGRCRRKRTRTDHEMATEQTAKIMCWLYCHFLIPLVRGSFYCTDTEFTGKQVNYYRKPVWSRIRSIALFQLKAQFEEIPRPEISEIFKNKILGSATLRLLPKPKGIRPIALLCKKDLSLAASIHLPTQALRSTNEALRQTFDVLDFEYQRKPHLFGSGLRGLHELHGKLLSFLKSREDARSDFYFVSVDIHKCYDNINVSHLHNLIKKILSKEEYVVQEHTCVHPSKNIERAMHKRTKNIESPRHVVNFLERVEGLVNGRSCTDSIFVDKPKCNVVRKSDLIRLLREHLEKNLLVSRNVFGPQLLRQKVGIPQGSILSSMLCNYYYGDIESRLLGGVFNKDCVEEHLLLRVIDDFLLITKDVNVAERFLDNLSSGLPNLGVKINANKTKTSHKIENASTQSTVAYDGETYFSWCGLMFNVKSCEVQIDYDRFASTKALDSLTINRVRSEGSSFAEKLKHFMKPRCSPVLFDSRINSFLTIKINFYQGLAMCAVKSTHYILEGLDSGISKNDKFITDSIVGVIAFTHRKVAKTTPFHVAIEKEDAMWLGAHAFEHVFKNARGNRFTQLISLLSRFKDRLRISSSVASLLSVAERALESFDLNRFAY